MKRKTLYLFIFSLTLAVSVHAQITDSTKQKFGKRKFTPEQRRELKKEFKNRWDSLTPQQKDAVKAGMRQYKNKYDSLPAEQKEKIRQRMKQRFSDSSFSRKRRTVN